MGMDKTVSYAEAAKLLGVQTAAVGYLVRSGIIRPIETGHNFKRRLLVREVAALAEVRGKKLTLPEVAGLALRAYALSKGNDQVIQELCHLLGVNHHALETTQEAVLALYLRARDTLTDLEQPDAEQVLEWARIFLAMNEGYLKLTEDHTANETPWQPFLAAAQKLSEEAPRHLFGARKELESAYGYLEAARRHLRHLAYFYVRDKSGARTANKAFDMQGDYSAPIVSLLFPH
jgi:hypothetical protein